MTTQVEHAPCDACKGGVVDDQHCWSHGYEPVPEGAHRVCGECGHCFVTEQDLIDADREWFTDVEPLDRPPVRPGSEIYSCPRCTHDF